MTDPVAVCRAFVDAIAWGEHVRVWELLAPEGRKTVLRIALERGMDEALVMRLRNGTASHRERNEFLTDLVNGLRTDLAGSDLDALEYELDPEPSDPGGVRVVLSAPMPEILGGGLPTGSLDLTEHDGRWVVERLIPRRAE
ncbi:MAG: hypothetical protein ACRD0U_12115 [Acidimicrobiales bacterium]